MPTGFILAQKHTLRDCFAGFFRALSSEKLKEVRPWLHPELDQLIAQQCHRLGEANFLRSLRLGLGSASNRLKLGASRPEGAGQIRADLVHHTGDPAGACRFVLMPDGWRIYALEVHREQPDSSPAASAPAGPRSPSRWTEARRPEGTPACPPPPQKGRSSPRLGVPRVLSNRWFARACGADSS